MVSPELIRRYQFFADFTADQIVALAKSANENRMEAEQNIFTEGEELDHFYMVFDGKVAIQIDQPDPNVTQPMSLQLMGDFIETQTVVSTVGPGEVFGWSALVAPHAATSSAKALVTSKIIAFNCRELQKEFDEDHQFAFLMMQKMAQVIRDRLRDMRIESLSTLVPQPEF